MEVQLEASSFIDMIQATLGIDAFYGVPDSLLRTLTDEIVDRHGFGGAHVVAADEGGAAALAAGHYLATGKPALVYLQNSGIGNAVNPICSLLNEAVYGIPVLFVIGWRGEPGVHDEPQHVFQGQCSKDLLESVGLSVGIVSPDTDEGRLIEMIEQVHGRFEAGKSFAFLIRKGALVRQGKHVYAGDGAMSREEALESVLRALPEGAAVVSTTGKLSRELFEIRERYGQLHESDFLTVGSMGHSSMIGLGIALAQPERVVAVLDGDGACLMHAGAMGVLAQVAPANIVHVLFNNNAHESVGGMPTASSAIDWRSLALAYGYPSAHVADSPASLAEAVGDAVASQGPSFVEAKVNTASRADLGRPTTSAFENGRSFQAFLAQ